MAKEAEVMPSGDGDVAMSGGGSVAAAPAAAPPAPSAASQVPVAPTTFGSPPSFPIGSVVVAQGLASRQDLVGRRGLVVVPAAAAPPDRVAVQFESGETVLLKRSNITKSLFPVAMPVGASTS